MILALKVIRSSSAAKPELSVNKTHTATTTDQSVSGLLATRVEIKAIRSPLAGVAELTWKQQ